ncbi:hypothetical protein, partial [Nocardia wallacei]|uniref:hypothetical protein n=1 Tax=Nocardia wallacei TaxID=480035 RepID=UPI002457DF63
AHTGIPCSSPTPPTRGAPAAARGGGAGRARGARGGPAPPGHCLQLDDPAPCGVVINESAVKIGVFNNWDRPLPDSENPPLTMPGSDDWNTYAQKHPDTATLIWDHWSTTKDPDGMQATLLDAGATSSSLGPGFKDTDGFYIGPHMRAFVTVESALQPRALCVYGPVYHQVHDGETAHVQAGKDNC